MANVLQLKVGDSSPWPVMTLKEAGEAKDLTSKNTITVRATRTHDWDNVRGTFTPLSTIGDPDIEGEPSDVELSAGRIQYTPASGDMAVPGMFRLEVEVLWNTGKKSTYPSGGYGSLILREDLD